MNQLSVSILDAIKEHRSLHPDQLDVLVPGSLTDVRCAISYLRQLGYVEIENGYLIMHDLEKDCPLPSHAPLVLTFTGKIALEEELSRRNEFRCKEFRAWATLAIAAAGLILAIISLLLQEL